MLNSKLCDRLRLAAQETFSLEEKPFFGIHEPVRELVDFLRASADEIERSNLSSLEKLRLVFAPTSDWDDAGGRRKPRRKSRTFWIQRGTNR